MENYELNSNTKLFKNFDFNLINYEEDIITYEIEYIEQLENIIKYHYNNEKKKKNSSTFYSVEIENLKNNFTCIKKTIDYIKDSINNKNVNVTLQFYE